MSVRYSIANPYLDRTLYGVKASVFRNEMISSNFQIKLYNCREILWYNLHQSFMIPMFSNFFHLT